MAVDRISLRECGLDDVATLALIGAATFLEAFAGTLQGTAILAHCARGHAPEYYRKAFAAPTTRAWLAEVGPDGAPVGYVMLTAPELPSIETTDRDLELKRIYLFSRFYGGGNGQILMDQAVSAARDAGAARLLLGVYRGNARGLAFYAKNGFVEIGVRTFRLGDHVYDDLVLGKDL